MVQTSWSKPLHCWFKPKRQVALPCTTKLEGSPWSFTRGIFQLHWTLSSASCKCKVTCPLERGEGGSIFFCFRKTGNQLNRSCCSPRWKLPSWPSGTGFCFLLCYPFSSEVVGSILTCGRIRTCAKDMLKGVAWSNALALTTRPRWKRKR